MNRVRSKVAGYTIVEVMIFLAVSGLLLASAMLLVNGQQAKTEFTNQVRDFDSKLQSVISNVSNGYYNSTGEITCTVNSGAIVSISVGGTKQGQNSDCTYIGQWISIPATPSNDKFIITSYAGLRRTAGLNPKEVTSLGDANPTAISDTAEDYVLLSGVTATMKTLGSPSSSFDTLAITTTFNSYDSDGLTSGSAKAEFHAYNGVSEETINPEGIQICLTDGTRYGEILLTTGSTSVTQGMGNICP